MTFQCYYYYYICLLLFLFYYHNYVNVDWRSLTMRKSLLWIILVVIFVPIVITGCGKKQEINEPTSSETSYENEITQEEYAQEETPEEVSSKTTETNEKVEFASTKQTDKDKTQTCSAPQAVKNTAHLCQHSFVLDSKKPASCTANGTNFHKCTKCGQTNQKSVPAHGHNFVETSNAAPTCTNSGSHTMRCTYCGHEYSEQTEAQLGHAFGGWTISEHHHSHSCSRCGQVEKFSHQLKDSICQVCGVVDFR